MSSSNLLIKDLKRGRENERGRERQGRGARQSAKVFGAATEKLFNAQTLLSIKGRGTLPLLRTRHSPLPHILATLGILRISISRLIRLSGALKLLSMTFTL